MALSLSSHLGRRVDTYFHSLSSEKGFKLKELSIKLGIYFMKIREHKRSIFFVAVPEKFSIKKIKAIMKLILYVNLSEPQGA